MADTAQLAWQDMNTSQKLAFCKANANLSYTVIGRKAGASDGAVANFFLRYGIKKGRKVGGRVPQYDRTEVIEKAAALWPMYTSQAQVGKALKLKTDTLNTIIDFARRNGDKRFPPHRRKRHRESLTAYDIGGAGAFEPRSKPFEDIEAAFLREKGSLDAVHRAMTSFPVGFQPRRVSYNAHQAAQIGSARCGLQ